MTPEASEDELTPAERRVVELLLVLRLEDEERPAGGDSLERRILRLARVQVMLRSVTPLIDGFVGALSDGLMILAGSRSRGGSR